MTDERFTEVDVDALKRVGEMWDKILDSITTPDAKGPEVESPKFQVGDRVRGKSSGMLTIIKYIGSEEVVYTDNTFDWIENVADCYNPAPYTEADLKTFIGKPCPISGETITDIRLSRNPNFGYWVYYESSKNGGSYSFPLNTTVNDTIRQLIRLYLGAIAIGTMDADVLKGVLS